MLDPSKALNSSEASKLFLGIFDSSNDGGNSSSSGGNSSRGRRSVGGSSGGDNGDHKCAVCGGKAGKHTYYGGKACPGKSVFIYANVLS